MNLSIVIPAKNEEGNLPQLLGELNQILDAKQYDYEIIVVNDNSSDSTGKIADEWSVKFSNIRALHLPSVEKGMGIALKRGTALASGKIVIWIMADRSDELKTIYSIVDKINQANDVVFASRYMKGGSPGDLNPIKAFLSSGYTFLSKILFGIKVHDITNAFRGFKKEVFDSLVLEADDFAISPEFAIKAHLRGFKLAEVPTRYVNRVAGKSKFGMLNAFITYTRLFEYFFKRFKRQ